jgi:hypothetical protein
MPMHTSTATIPTASGSRYLQQLCKHWSHKFAVEFTPQKGRIPFGDGRVCVLEASGDALVLTAQASDPEALDRLQRVVIEHLKRFAFRENLDGVAWT